MNLLGGAHFSRWKFYEFVLVVLVYFHHTRFVSTSVTVVRRWPYRNEAFVSEVVNIPFFHQLMCPCNRVKIIDMQEFLCDLFWKQVPSPTIAHWPSFDVRVWVWPYQIAHIASFRDFSDSFNVIHFIQKRNVGRETAMNTHERIVDDSN